MDRNLSLEDHAGIKRELLAHKPRNYWTLTCISRANVVHVQDIIQLKRYVGFETKKSHYSRRARGYDHEHDIFGGLSPNTKIH